jgi:hypothetical protein
MKSENFQDLLAYMGSVAAHAATDFRLQRIAQIGKKLDNSTV